MTEHINPTKTTLLACLALLLVLILLPAQIISAHQEREIAGKYRVLLGWQSEPVIVYETNTLTFRFTDINTHQGVPGLEKALKVKVQAPDGKTQDMTLSAVDNAGHYATAPFTPSVEGGYIIILTGVIDELKINETFNPEPARFRTEVQNPTASPLQQAANKHDDSLSTAASIGLGVIIVVVVLLYGGYVLWSRRKRPTP